MEFTLAMSLLHWWAIRHNVAPEAIRELEILMGTASATPAPTLSPAPPRSEDAVKNECRLIAARRGDMHLWRNNVGVLEDDRGIPLRFGLANDSSRINKVIKSADLIGIRKVQITPGMVGRTMGQFVSLEIKEGGWRYTGKGREAAQRVWLDLINAMGGDARFISDPSQLTFSD
jgi:hypothetical protein